LIRTIHDRANKQGVVLDQGHQLPPGKRGLVRGGAGGWAGRQTLVWAAGGVGPPVNVFPCLCVRFWGFEAYKSGKRFHS
jgi:hypothetical protein